MNGRAGRFVLASIWRGMLLGSALLAGAGRWILYFPIYPGNGTRAGQ